MRIKKLKERQEHACRITSEFKVRICDWYRLQTSKLPWANNTEARRRPGFHDRYGMTLFRMLAIGILFTGIIFGSTYALFSIGEAKFIIWSVDADLQLAFLGIFNKVLDVLLVLSLEHSASIMLTKWMTLPASARQDQVPKGAAFSDFRLKEELTKPWSTLINFWIRVRRFGWTWKSCGRLILGLIVSICVLLTGLAVNTVAIPKQRWYPEQTDSGFSITPRIRKITTITHPKSYIQGVDWLSNVNIGQGIVGKNGSAPWDWALGVSAVQSYIGLSQLVSICAKKAKAWQITTTMTDAPLGWTGLYTIFNDTNRPVETLSVQERQIWDVFYWMRAQGHKTTIKSTGWFGDLNLMVPVLNTECVAKNVSTVTDSSINLILPSNGIPSFALDFGLIANSSFSGARCNISFYQALFPVSMWIVNMAGATMSLNRYSDDPSYRIIYQPMSPYDYNITTNLAIQARDTLPRLVSLVHDRSLLQYFLLISRQLQEVDSKIGSDTKGLAIVLGVFLQNFLTASAQLAPLPTKMQANETMTSHPITWQVYGSGPRLAWEWSSVFILLVDLLVFCFGISQLLIYWMGPGTWLEPDGMMKLAQLSPRLSDIEDDSKAQTKVYWVAQTEDNQLQLRCRDSIKS